MMHGIFYWILRFLYRVFCRWEIHGLENFPEKGGFVLAVNHASYLDPTIAGSAAPRSTYYMARESLMKNPIVRWFLTSIHTIPMDIGKGDLGAFKTCLKTIAAGKPVLIFPEGTRAKKDEFGQPVVKLHDGIGFLVVKSGVSVVPAKIEDSDQVLPPGAVMFRRYPISIIFGKPMIFNAEESYQKIVSAIMKEINQLSRESCVSP